MLRQPRRCLRYLKNNTKGVIYRFIGWKSLRYRRFQDDYIGSGGRAPGVFAADKLAEIGTLVFRTQLIVISFLHRFFVPGASRDAH